MLFIIVLILSTAGLAVTAAFFSIYGLAATFSGVFWSVVAMGASLEAGKLVAVSYLYRYWTRTNIWLKLYLMFGVTALMLLTSTGIYGYLSAGYQQDTLPLKQKQEQVRLLEEEKQRVLLRKQEIDTQLSGGPQINSIQSTDGRIDPNAARVLRETNRSRTAVVAQYKAEQTTINARATELDQQLLALKQELIQVEAHTGPITYIAKSFGLPTDNATMYLILIIIFAFDPMAVALTLAVNIALRLRKEDAEKEDEEEEKLYNSPPYVYPVTPVEEVPTKLLPVAPQSVSSLDSDEPPIEEPEPVFELEPISKPPVEPELVETPVQLELEPIEQPTPVKPAPEVIEPVVETVEPLEVTAAPIPDPVQHRRTRPYTDLWKSGDSTDQAKIAELVDQRRYHKRRQKEGHVLDADEQWELDAIENILRREGMGVYLD